MQFKPHDLFLNFRNEFILDSISEFRRNFYFFIKAGLFCELAGKSSGLISEKSTDFWECSISKEILSACKFLLLYYYCTFVHLYRYSNNNSHVRKNLK